MTTRSDAIACVLAAVGDALVVAANGMISREACYHADRNENFYMIGSMGLASSIGLGVATARPDRRVVVLDGDGNVLMGLGTLAMIGEQLPRNLTHVVFDNESYGSTGGQRSISDRISLERIAAAAGYAHAERVDTLEGLDEAVRAMLSQDGPSFLLAKVAPGALPGVPRVPYPPEEITERFMAAVGRAT
jgi:thiamine pyrophosphate-dependent acetolactate synthase large subunit-like protein